MLTGTDYFQYLGLPQKLEIDRGELEARFYSLSRKLHPDLYFERPAPERRLAEEAAARLNDAYRTLKDPISRAAYLLVLHGVKQDASAAPPELLDEVFELKMALEPARAGDAAARAQLAAAKAKFDALLAESGRSLQAAAARWDRTGGRDALDQIARLLGRRSYIQNLLRDVGAVLE
ncbi:MAG TPA: Fe-S protein assembly co-chaperone HscB [Bryobacterales bacterium]|nr:Fe-S protein assembly co-chaperone HscB [Bryobacterales bacterium]